MDTAAHSTQALTARYVLPMAGPPLAGGAVVIAGDRIVEVCSRPPQGLPCQDLGNAALLPGWVNAHTHLEFSRLAAPLGAAGAELADWIMQVVVWRLSRATDESARALLAGLQESRQADVAALGDINTGDAIPEDASLPGGVLFRELLGAGADRTAPLLELAADHLAAATTGWRHGLSPHAPYTVRPELVEGAARLAAEFSAPVAMHLAESAAELELLQSHAGPLRLALERLKAWDPTAIPRGIAILDYLRMLEPAQRLLVIHGNYLLRDDIEYLASQRERAAVVYCPRTHAYFGHGDYPLPEFLERGLTVALGTDSRASNPDLSMLAELRFAARRFPQLEPAQLVRMATVNGAQALGLADSCGTLEPGRRAQFAVVDLPQRSGSDPYALLLGRDARK